MDAPPQDSEVDSSGIQSCMDCGRDGIDGVILNPDLGMCSDCISIHRVLYNEPPVYDQAQTSSGSNIEQPSSSDDAGPYEYPPSPKPAGDFDDIDFHNFGMEGDYEEEDEDGFENQNFFEVGPSWPRPKSLGVAKISKIARSYFTASGKLRRTDDPARADRLFYEQLKAIPSHERVMFLHKIEVLYYSRMKSNRL